MDGHSDFIVVTCLTDWRDKLGEVNFKRFGVGSPEKCNSRVSHNVGCEVDAR
jgi:hypothetical protein